MDVRAAFRAWVAKLKAEGLTQKQIAERIECSESALSRLIEGRRGCGMKLAYQVEQAAARDGVTLPAHLWIGVKAETPEPAEAREPDAA